MKENDVKLDESDDDDDDDDESDLECFEKLGCSGGEYVMIFDKNCIHKTAVWYSDENKSKPYVWEKETKKNKTKKQKQNEKFAIIGHVFLDFFF